MIFRITVQGTVKGVTVGLLTEGVWFRLRRWKEQGYWITWAKEKRFSERCGYEKPIWQIGKGKYGRLACFLLESPGWYVISSGKGSNEMKNAKE